MTVHRGAGALIDSPRALPPTWTVPTMGWLVIKYLLTAAIVVAVSEGAKRSEKLGGLIAALPLVTFLTLIWLRIEGQPRERISNHAWYTFWYVVPTLPMFLAFPWLHERIGFWWALASSAVMTGVCSTLFAALLKRFGVELL